MKKSVEKMHVEVRAQSVKRNIERQGPTVGVRQERVNYNGKKNIDSQLSLRRTPFGTGTIGPS